MAELWAKTVRQEKPEKLRTAKSDPDMFSNDIGLNSSYNYP